MEHFFYLFRVNVKKCGGICNPGSCRSVYAELGVPNKVKKDIQSL